ncbi:ATP-binding protein [Acidithiobacillus sp. AMEEHan]|uniref:sensor histidine kinase n=1 Tax=Acidithiobacillus sp. AMEEHan TaxID=2994951 RepID=UPI0027E573AB|nr:ATP-binding protein [Acidithiobacillus sp. AMEEHan]
MSERQHPSPRRYWLRALRQNDGEEGNVGFLRWWAVLLILVVLGFLAFTFFVSAAGPLSPFFIPMLLASAAIVLLLLVLVMVAVARLLLRLRRGEVGSQLATRLVVIITILSLTPAAVVFAFSWRYLNQGIDSWLSAAVESALEQAVDVAKAGVDRYRSSTLLSAETIAQALTGQPDSAAVLTVIQMRDQFRLSSVTLFSSSNRIIATSSDNLELVPRLPHDLLLGAHANHPLVKMADENGQLLVRVLIPVMNPQFGRGNRLLYVEQVVPEQFSRAAAAVQNADHRYRQLTLMRGPMKTAFQMTLAVALLLTALSALWIALLLARRLTAPIARLAAGTQAVARGEFIPLQIIPSNDELGVLLHSFNNMTRQLARAKQQAAKAQEEADQRRYYLETILAQISSGILIFSNEGKISEINAAARQILRLPESGLPDPEKEPQLATFWAQAQDWISQPRNDMQRELQIERSDGTQTLLLHGARFAELGGAEGFVVVFDDISPLVAAQRSAAWGEVARRLAHEIKNPLTPIQLSAERLRRKYLERLGGEGETLDRATHTIIQQVDALKVLVDAFSEYARAPKLDLHPIDLNALIADVVELYRGQGAGVEIRCDLAPDLPSLRADAHRLRQILNNLLRNAIDAIAAAAEPAAKAQQHIWIRTRMLLGQEQPMLEWTVEDDGPGFPADLLARVFEPYVTSKPKGSGLGLAIVRRIVEEHGGQIEAGNREAGGARVAMRFPLAAGVAEEV